MPSRVTPFGSEDTASNIWIDGNAITPSGCLNFYRSAMIEGYFYKECPSGQSGTGVYFQVPEGKFLSQVSQEAADAAAQAYFTEQGQLLANDIGACEFGQFYEVFTSIQAAVNWDWIADKDDPTVFPYTPSFVSNDGRLPLSVIEKFSGLTGAALNGFQPFQFDIHSVHGLMHFNFALTHPERDDLLVAWYMDRGDFTANLFAAQTLHGFLIADHGSIEIHGMDPESEDYDPEYVPFELGGMLGIIETTDSINDVFTDGHFNGYIISYSDAIYVRKWNTLTSEYDIIETIPFEMKNKTVYFGYGIRYDQGEWAAEIYLNGAWQASIFDDKITAFTGVRYQRGVLSVDYWFGDYIIGSMSPFTNRVPGKLTIKHYNATEITNQTTELFNGNHNIYIPAVPNVPEASILATLSNDTTRFLANEQTSYVAGSFLTENTPFFFQTAFIGLTMKFDLTSHGELGDRLYGCFPFITWRLLETSVASFPNGMNREYKEYDSNDNNWSLYRIPEESWPFTVTDPLVPNNYNPIYQTLYEDTGRKQAPFAYCYPDRFENQAEIYQVSPWISSVFVPFQFTGLLYTKQEIADTYVQWWLYPQLPNYNTTYTLEVAQVKIFSGVNGIRTEELLEAPVWPTIACPEIPECSAENRMLIAYGIWEEGLGGEPDHYKIVAPADCDTLYNKYPLYNQTTWNWTIGINDILADGARRLVFEFGSLYNFGDLVFDPNQISGVLTQHVSLFLKVWRDDWKMMVWSGVITFVDGEIVVPPPPNNDGLPTSTTIHYHSDVQIMDDNPIIANIDGATFRFEFYPHESLGDL